jgi:hypothetical protein
MTVRAGIGIAVLIGVLAVFWFALEGERLPPDVETWNRMIVLKRHTRQNNSLPRGLGDLQPAPGSEIDREDGWGQPIGYSVQPGEIVVMASHPPAGHGNDIIRSLHSKNKSKQWAGDSDELFIEEPQVLKATPKK